MRDIRIGAPIGLWPLKYLIGKSFDRPACRDVFSVSGVTRDNSGLPLKNCKVELYETSTSIKITQTVSGESGEFTLFVGTNSGTFFLRAYKVGSPDVTGVTVDSLIANVGG